MRRGQVRRSRVEGWEEMTIRCKMTLEAVISAQWGGVKAFYRCVYDPKLIEEDVSFQKATPSGQAEFVVDNPKAIEQLVIGKSYYVDFTPVE
jgi:hypothetical protein